MTLNDLELLQGQILLEFCDISNEYTENAEQTHRVSWLTRGINPLGTGGRQGGHVPPKFGLEGTLIALSPQSWVKITRHMGHMWVLSKQETY